MDGIIIRLATEQDFEELSKLYFEFHEFHVRGVPDRLRSMDDLNQQDQSRLDASLSRTIHGEDSALFVAQVSHSLVGLAEVYLRQDEESNALIVAHQYGYLLLRKARLPDIEADPGQGHLKRDDQLYINGYKCTAQNVYEIVLKASAGQTSVNYRGFTILRMCHFLIRAIERRLGTVDTIHKPVVGSPSAIDARGAHTHHSNGASPIGKCEERNRQTSDSRSRLARAGAPPAP